MWQTTAKTAAVSIIWLSLYGSEARLYFHCNIDRCEHCSRHKNYKKAYFVLLSLNDENNKSITTDALYKNICADKKE
jgi:hypothetical protein